MNLTDPDHPILFTLPYEISPADQVSILDYAYAHAGSWSGQVQVWNNQLNQHEQTDYFGRVQITRLTEASRQRLGEDYHSDWSNWAGRLDSNLEWEWIDTPITDLVRGYVQQVQHLYQRFHRVLILVQRVGSNIPLHTDRVVKNIYPDGVFQPGPAENLPIDTADTHWQNNRYLALKWPLTELANNNGEPLVEIDSTVYRYDVDRHCFAINEVDIKHGANAVGHRRGVIFLDGILDYERLQQESWGLAKLEALLS
jgi:hypothetical protein